jgi:hypothetical protein
MPIFLIFVQDNVKTGFYKVKDTAMKILHNILKGISLTGALFVFQACYGMPGPPVYDEPGEAPLAFSLVSAQTGAPLEGIHIIASTSQFGADNPGTVLGTTGADGCCTVTIPYSRDMEGPYIRFVDDQNIFSQKDTSLTDLREREIIVKMDPR